MISRFAMTILLVLPFLLALPAASARAGGGDPCAADGICNYGACKATDPDCAHGKPGTYPIAIVDTPCGGKVGVLATDSPLGLAAAKVAARVPNFNVAQKVQNPSYFDSHPSGALATGHGELKGFGVTMVQGNWPKPVDNASGDLGDPTLLFFRKSGAGQDNWGLIGMGYSFALDRDNQAPPTKMSPTIESGVWFIHEAGYHHCPGDGGFTCATSADLKYGGNIDAAGCNGVTKDALITHEFDVDHKHGRYWAVHVWFEPGTLRPSIGITDPWCRQTSAALGAPACAFFRRTGACVTPPPPVVADVVLTGDVSDTGVSGKTGGGAPFTTAGDDSATHAMYGLSSQERSDAPCLVTIKKENVNAAADDTSQREDHCGPKGATSSEIAAQYPDTGSQGTRAFVTAVQVCMNNDKTRVKGFRVNGQRIDNGGHLVPMLSGPAGSGTANGQDTTISYIDKPVDSRTNCDSKDGWMAWAACPAGQVATAAKLHYAAGSDPRSLTGIALRCRAVAPK